jgi:SAM-dependent methyltransferase
MQNTGSIEGGAFKRRSTCQICDSEDLRPFLDFGDVPLAGGFLKKEDLHRDALYPQTICFCEQCKEVQVKEIVPAEVLFRDYRYVSSTTQTLRDHFERYAKEMAERFLAQRSFVVEFGSNDGVLLKPFRDLGIQALGVEPAVNISQLARDQGCEVINDFFNTTVAAAIVITRGHADLICANNIFAHIDDMHEPMRAIRHLLKPDGVFVCEVHYLLDLIKSFQYDMFYHEHIMHHSLRALSYLLNRYDMEVFDVKRVTTHSGSIRVYSQKRGSGRQPVSSDVGELLALEEKEGIYEFETFVEFSKGVHQRRHQLIELVRNLRAEGKRIVGYGASGRATVHMNFCNFGTDDVEYVVDASHEREGRYIPGVHVPIVNPRVLETDRPDYALVFAYNYMDEIVKKETAFLSRGGKFIVPLPEPMILE